MTLPVCIDNIMTFQGLEWAGFPALAFYMHTILEETSIPVDEYWAAGFISLYRLFIISHRALMPHCNYIENEG